MSLFSPTRPRRIGMRLNPSFVLASLNASPYGTKYDSVFRSLRSFAAGARLGAPWSGG